MALKAFHEGGIFMYFILLLGVATVLLITERTFALYLKFKERPLEIRNKLLGFIQIADLDGATAYLKTLSQGIVGQIAVNAVELRARDAGEEELQARMD